MPIAYGIDREKRLVVALPYGTMEDADVFGYQREVWSLPDVAGFDELIDMTDVQHIALPSAQRVVDLAELSAGMEAGGEKGRRPARMAIVAPSDLAFGLGRMYQAYRAMKGQGVPRQVGVFRTMAEALEFLGIEGGPQEAERLLGLARNRNLR
ncbi:MAG TPA: hypothetical protein VFV75_04530 [Candidatus Polarisedimenticolaceae bacterium]|nr:hypothetical protein [Candidatus Polarisedimenticolaceae bacterium]